MNKDIKIRNQLIVSKFFLAPINTGFTRNGTPDERLIEFYNDRSGKNIGICYIGNVAIGKNYRTNNQTAYYKDEDKDKWLSMTQMIRKNGSLPGVQLGCKVSLIEGLRFLRNDNIDSYVKLACEEFGSLKKSDIDTVINSYVEASIFSYEVGFKVIQIHAAHGYFLSKSLSENFNVRKDEFGKKIEILDRIVLEIRRKIPDCILDVRISIYEGVTNQDDEYNYKSSILDSIAKLDVDIISLSNGIYNIDKRLIYPKIGIGTVINEDIGIDLAIEHPYKIWNVAGNVYDVRLLRGLNIPNLTYSIGRSLIADSEFLKKSHNKEFESIKKCTECNNCHYYSNLKLAMTHICRKKIQ